MNIRILGLGGTLRDNSTTAKAIRVSLRVAERQGAQTELLDAPQLQLPLYGPQALAQSPAVERLVRAMRAADGLIVGSPSYHGSVSGAVKNALDYAEELRQDAPPYFEGKAVGCLAVGAGTQAPMETVNALRAITHALRGWPTPLAAVLNARNLDFDEAGECTDTRAQFQLCTVGEQVVEFAKMRKLWLQAK